MIRFLICLFLILPTFEAFAQNIQWNQPEVVHEKLARDNRRVLRLSGTTKPGAQIRIRENKVKMMFMGKKARWARIPQKHRVQFPLIASDTGSFSFELYLPMVPVEIPIEIFRAGKWVPYRFSFEVPSEGSADDFKFVEESFKIRKDEENTKVEEFLAEYDRDEDYGQVVNDRGEWKSWVTGKVILWGSLGFSYMSLTQDLTTTAAATTPVGTVGGVDFPFWELGGEYRWDPKWKLDLAYLSRPGTADPDGNYTLQNTDIGWTELRANLTYYPISWEKEKYRWGFKGGFQRHDIPLLKRVSGANPQGYRVFSNDILFFAAGVNFETMRAKDWNIDATAQLIYPITAGGEFDVSNAYGLHGSFAMFKEVIPALMLGGKVDLHYMTFDAEHPEFTLNTATVNSSTSLWQITPSFLMRTEF